jgi:hypothetical protein
MDVIVNLQFSLVEPLWTNFWGGPGNGTGSGTGTGELGSSEGMLR